jgi:putative tricarboxylic transport membrane protein
VIIGPMSRIAQSLGLRELFLIAKIGLALIAGVVGENFKKGLIAATLGLLISMMSGSPITAHVRWTLGFPQLYEGVPFIPALIGLFAYTQMFILARQESFFEKAGELGASSLPILEKRGVRGTARELWNGIRTTLSFPGHLIRGTALGTFIGAIPATVHASGPVRPGRCTFHHRRSGGVADAPGGRSQA